MCKKKVSIFSRAKLKQLPSFSLDLPKIWDSQLHRNYIFKISNCRVYLLGKFHMLLSLRLSIGSHFNIGNKRPYRPHI